MKDFFRYLGQIARHGFAVGVTSLGILGEVVRLSGREVPVPRWVDIALLLVGVVWGGYVVYRDKQPPPMLGPTGPTPLSAFHSSLSTLPRHLPMAEMVIGYEVKEDLRFSETEFDAIDQWLKSLVPASVGARTDLSFIRRQVNSENDVLIWHTQVMPPGPVLSLDKVIGVHTVPDGTAADLEALFSYWTRIVSAIPTLSSGLGSSPTRIACELQPYPSEGGPVVDLWFTHVPRPPSTGAAGMVPPWQEIYDLDKPEDVADVPERAAGSLLRHFGYRDFDETVRQLLRMSRPDE